MNKEALTYAFNLLSIADRSEQILLEKVERRFDKSSAIEVLKYLRENNFVNDQRYTKNLVNNYQELRHFGRNRIKLELMKKKISPDIISREIANLENEENGCLAATQNWLRKKHITEKLDYATRNKLLSFLMRRGFDYETAKGSADECLNNFG